MNYELYPIHCFKTGTVISNEDYKKLSKEEKLKFGESERKPNYHLIKKNNEFILVNN